MQRDMMITPRRLEFARTKEQELSDTLMRLALEKQEEIKNLVAESIQSARSNILNSVSSYEFIGTLVLVPHLLCGTLTPYTSTSI